MHSPGLWGPALCAVLYIHPMFIHILEICARNVYNLACSILQLHCLKHSAASKFHSVPVQRLLFVAAGIDGAKGSFLSSAPQTCLGRRWPGDLVASTRSWEEARPHFLCDFSKEELLQVYIGKQQNVFWEETKTEHYSPLLIHTSTQIPRSQPKLEELQHIFKLNSSSHWGPR